MTGAGRPAAVQARHGRAVSCHGSGRTGAEEGEGRVARQPDQPAGRAKAGRAKDEESGGQPGGRRDQLRRHAALPPCRLAARGRRHHPAGMFVVTEAEAAAIRAAFEREGELSAAVELRRLFPGVTDMAEARECARTIASWAPLPLEPAARSRKPR